MAKHFCVKVDGPAGQHEEAYWEDTWLPRAIQEAPKLAKEIADRILRESEVKGSVFWNCYLLQETEISQGEISGKEELSHE